MKPLPNLSEADAAFIRGYVAATAEFARRQTEPRIVLRDAQVTLPLAKLSGVSEIDLIALEGQFARTK